MATIYRPAYFATGGHAAPSASVAISGLGKSFDDNRVLDALDLDIAAGDFVSIVGRSGCGKSTLLRLILGLERPDHGTIATDLDRARVVFQEPRLLPWATVRANVEVGAATIEDFRERQTLVDETLALVGLASKGGEWPASLSGGQRQRVALARALVSRPRLLVLDEPLGALDALTRLEMQRLLADVWRTQAFTAILVTHDVTEAVALGDRVVVMEHGRITLDLPIVAPHPRRHGDADLARIEGRILERLLTNA